MKKAFTKPIILFFLSVIYFINCNAQWSTDPNVDNALNATIAVSGPDMTFCTDGHGGAIYSWFANGPRGYLVYANRIDSVGNIRWGSAGVLLHSDSLQTVILPNPSICEDGKGGCYVAFTSNTISSHPIICQHLDSTGAILWAVQGKMITTTFSSQYYQAYPSLVNDNGKGVFVAFYNNAINASGLYAQRLTFAGGKAWGNSGASIEMAGDIRQPQAISDGKNGIAVVWTNYSFDGLGHQFQIRMNRLDHNGLVRFPFGSEKVNTIEGIGYGPFIRLMLSKKKNYIIAWTSDGINTSKVFSQKLDSLGNFLWGSSEIKVRDTTGDAERPDIVSDGTDGAYYVWLDGRKINVASGVFVQHINASGSRTWKSQGLLIDSVAENSPHIAPDISNGMKIFWTSEPANRDYMQQVNKNGLLKLPGIGVAVAAESHTPSFYQRVLPVSNNHDILFLRYGDPGAGFAKYVPLDGVLPLNMISFDGVNKGSINLLSWQTTSAINTSYFSVERGENGNDFSEIAKVKSTGSATISSYNYSDASSSNTNSYYRLKTTDVDGNVTYSNIINMKQNINTSIRIIPNPAIQNCIIYFDAVADGNAALKIFDINGRLQKQMVLNAKQSSATIDVSSFSAGTYFCRLETEGKTFTEKLVVVK